MLFMFKKIFLKMKNKILLIGGSGSLGNEIINSNLFQNIYAPKKKILKLIKPKTNIFYIKKKKYQNYH